MAKAYSYDFRQKVIESIELDGYHDKTQAEMAELWDGPISARTISRALAKIGFTRKKNYGYCQRNEAQREPFRQLLGDPKAPHIT